MKYPAFFSTLLLLTPFQSSFCAHRAAACASARAAMQASSSWRRGLIRLVDPKTVALFQKTGALTPLEPDANPETSTPVVAELKTDSLITFRSADTAQDVAVLQREARAWKAAIVWYSDRTRRNSS